MCEIAWSESTEIRGDASLLLSLSRERSRMGELARERWTLDLSLSEKEKERYSLEGVGEIGNNDLRIGLSIGEDGLSQVVKKEIGYEVCY